jgi:hypothetical protein
MSFAESLAPLMRPPKQLKLDVSPESFIQEEEEEDDAVSCPNEHEEHLDDESRDSDHSSSASSSLMRHKKEEPGDTEDWFAFYDNLYGAQSDAELSALIQSK